MGWNLLLSIQYYRNNYAYHWLFDKNFNVNKMYLGCYLTDFELTVFLAIEKIGKANTFVFCFQMWYIKIRDV